MLKKLSWIIFLGCLMLIRSNSMLAQYKDIKQFKEKYKIQSGKIFHVYVDIDAAEVKFNISPRNYEARVTIFYTEDEFKVYSGFDERRSRLDVEFEKKGWVDSGHNDVKAEVIIDLPPKIDIDLNAKIKAGDIEIDLGGLALVNLDLTTWAGEVLVEFSEPNKAVMEFLKINTKIGETDIVRLGNARFKEAEINGGIGEMDIDFRGKYLTDAEANIDLDIGETKLYLPDEVGIKLSISKFLFMSKIDLPRRFKKSGRYYYSHNYDDSKNELVLRVSPGLGELKIDY